MFQPGSHSQDHMPETQHVVDHYNPAHMPETNQVQNSAILRRGQTGKFHQEHHMTLSNVRQDLVEMKYAVRGAVVAKAEEMKRRLQAGEQLPFKEIILCNVGNPHAVQQKPVTFYRQVLACCTHPELCEDSSMPVDVKARAQEYLAATSGNSIGAYTSSTGLKAVRKQIAAFIE